MDTSELKKYKVLAAVVGAKELTESVDVDTTVGTLRGEPGDYLVLLPGEHTLVVKRDLFQMMFREYQP